MLNYWYSEKCSREIKLVVCIITCALIYFCSTITPLQPINIGLCLGIGVALHVIYKMQLKLYSKNKYAQGFQILFFVLPIILINFSTSSTTEVNKIWVFIQSLGFIFLGLFVVSIYENRSKRSEG